MSIADAVSPLVGLVTGLDELLPSPDDARHFQVVALPALAAVTLGRAAVVPGQPGSGYGTDRALVRAAAIGETLERYAATYVPEHELVAASAAELGPSAATPETFALFAAEQHAIPGFPFVPFASETRVHWAPAQRVRDGTDAWVPAQLTYLGFPAEEAPIGYSTSNGLAAAEDWDTALLRALLELLERDAFMLAWNARLSFARLDWRRSPQLAAYHGRYLEPSRARLTTVDLSPVHAVPTVLAVVRGNPGALVVGAGCAPTVDEAWKKSVTEAYAVRKAAREYAQEEPSSQFTTGFDDVREFADHIRVYAHEEHAWRASFLDAATASQPSSAVAPLEGRTASEQVQSVAQGLAARGIETYAVDVTSPDVRELGVVVARAIAPRLIPLDVRHDARFLGGDRLYTAPVELGFADRPLSFDEINPDPHPFP
jgi:ribosomal protein S12 methylthiotransferase accessory factor